jgi:hypothetical protein
MNKKSVIFVACVVLLAARFAGAEPTYRLKTTRTAGDVDRVQALLEVGGRMMGERVGKKHETKLSVVCNLAYHEKMLAPAGTKDSVKSRSVRYYDKAQAAVKTENAELKPTLRQQRRLIAAEFQSDKDAMFSPAGPLSRAELELINIQGNTMLLDQLLPSKSVSVGDKWELPYNLAAALFGPDTVTESDVQCTLTEVTDKVARVEISGKLKGTCDGATTNMEVKGKYRFDRRMGRIDWFALLVKENRQGNAVTNGLEVMARVQVRVTPDATCDELSTAALENVAIEDTPKSNRLQYEPSGKSWQCEYDRRWIITQEAPHVTDLRMVDRGDMLARCGISPLPNTKPGEVIELSKFQEDVRQGLGKSFGAFVSAGVELNSANYRVYRVVVSGEARTKADGKEQAVPIQWRYYLVSEKSGRRMVFVFSMEQSLAERFGGEDLKLVNSLCFAEKEDDSDSNSTASNDATTNITEKRNGTNR